MHPRPPPVQPSPVSAKMTTPVSAPVRMPVILTEPRIEEAQRTVEERSAGDNVDSWLDRYAALPSSPHRQAPPTPSYPCIPSPPGVIDLDSGTRKQGDRKTPLVEEGAVSPQQQHQVGRIGEGRPTAMVQFLARMEEEVQLLVASTVEESVGQLTLWRLLMFATSGVAVAFQQCFEQHGWPTLDLPEMRAE